MNGRSAIASAFAASVAVHILLLAVVPGFRWRLPVRPWERIEVQFLRPEEPPLPQPEPVKPPKPPPEPPAPLLPRQAEAVARGVAARLARAAPPPPAVPPVRPPPSRIELPEPETVPWFAPVRPPPVPPSEPAARAEPLQPGPSVKVPEAILGELLAGARAGEPEKPERAPDLPPLRIEWQEGAERRLVYAPPPPRLDIRNEAEVRVRFWVSPRGEVTQALVVRRGDPELDAAALDYVRRLRFNALPPGDEKEQWGTVTLRFLLE